jgi:hypothetical protein
MMVITVFCMWTIAYCLRHGLDNRSAETAIEMAFLCLTGIVSSYVFGATWENIHRMKLPPPKVKDSKADAARSD